MIVYFAILLHVTPADSVLFYLGKRVSEPNSENITYTSSGMGQTLCSGHGRGQGDKGKHFR